MSFLFRTKITGVGFYVPEQVVTNSELEKYMDTSDQWIRERTGIAERRFFKEGYDTVSRMGARASRIALERAGIKPQDIDMVLFATLSPDYNFPGSGVLMLRELGLSEIPAIDIRMQCSGFIYGLSIADQYIKTGMYKNILVVGSEIQSNIFELSTRGRAMAVIFGDGAGAAVLQATQPDDPNVLLSTHLHSDGTYAEELMLEHPGSNLKNRITHQMIDEGKMLPYMNGQLVFKHAVKRFPEVVMEALTYNQLTVNDIDMFIPHQANIRISEYVQRVLGLPDEKVFNNIHKYGNTTAASIPIALSEVWEAGRLKKGDLLCLAAFGSGFTWASALIRWGMEMKK
jgi:3-oxoacyl-[acyl-carrier-protein] synthase-3